LPAAAIESKPKPAGHAAAGKAVFRTEKPKSSGFGFFCAIVCPLLESKTLIVP